MDRAILMRGLTFGQNLFCRRGMRKGRIELQLFHGGLLLVLCLLLAACAGQPSGSHSFAVAAVGGQQGVWKLDRLAGNGRIDLTARLHGDSATAAMVVLKFNDRDKYGSDVALAIDDFHCRGAYAMGLSYDKGRSWITDYLDSRLPWDETLKLRMEWRGDGRFRVVVNGREEKTVRLDVRVSDLAIATRYGEMVIDKLTYTELAADSPFAPLEIDDQ